MSHSQSKETGRTVTIPANRVEWAAEKGGRPPFLSDDEWAEAQEIARKRHESHRIERERAEGPGAAVCV